MVAVIALVVTIVCMGLFVIVYENHGLGTAWYDDFDRVFITMFTICMTIILILIGICVGNFVDRVFIGYHFSNILGTIWNPFVALCVGTLFSRLDVKKLMGMEDRILCVCCALIGLMSLSIIKGVKDDAEYYLIAWSGMNFLFGVIINTTMIIAKGLKSDFVINGFSIKGCLLKVRKSVLISGSFFLC